MKDTEKKKIEITEVDRLFVDDKDAKFWKTEGAKHNNLYWIRAMVSRKREPAPVEDEDVLLPKNAEEKIRNYKARAVLYRFLSDGYNEPTEEFTKAVTDGSFCNQLTNILNDFKSNRRMDDGRGAICNMKEKEFASTFDELKKEYCRNIYDTNLPFVSPYESVYRGERQVMGSRAFEVNELYKKAGLGIEGTEMPDHISHECEFVSVLSERIVKSIAEGKTEDAERYQTMCNEFLRDHLLQWGAKFCEDLLTLAKSDFYKGIALLGRGAFNMEYNRLRLMEVL